MYFILFFYNNIPSYKMCCNVTTLDDVCIFIDTHLDSLNSPKGVPQNHTQLPRFGTFPPLLSLCDILHLSQFSCARSKLSRRPLDKHNKTEMVENFLRHNTCSLKPRLQNSSRVQGSLLFQVKKKRVSWLAKTKQR